MAILIDPPTWPAHGTLWSHLISDHSLTELQRFAAQLKIPRKGFDLDHYDVPLSRYRHAIELGARPVTARDVVHSLQQAGLRVRQKDRAQAVPRARADYLLGEWHLLGQKLRTHSTADEWISVGRSLLSRWREPHRSYHDERHLEDVLLAFDQLALRGTNVDTTAYAAAWFHDAIYTGVAGADEAASAKLAHTILGNYGVSRHIRSMVTTCIIATAPVLSSTVSAPSGSDKEYHFNSSAAVLRDADLSIFAASERRYREYAENVRTEYAHVPEATYAAAREKILAGYLRQPRLFYTQTAFELWEERARTNVTAEVATLKQRSNPRLFNAEAT